MELWLIVIGMGLVTYAVRLLPIALLERIEIPILVQRALRYVPPAVVTRIIFPELLQPHRQLNLSFRNARLLAGIVAALVAWRTKTVLLTIGLGMVTLWVLQSLLPG